MILNQTRRVVYLPLSACRAPEAVLQRLASLGITTLEELQDHWTYGDREMLLDYLGQSPVRFLKGPTGVSFSRAPGTTGRAASGESSVSLQSRRPLVRRPRGLELAPTQRTHRSRSPESVSVSRRRQPEKVVSLQRSFGAVRDQDERGTCVAFASVALLEYHLYENSQKRRHHSEQFVYWACKQRDDIPKQDGTYIPTGREVLKEAGACVSRTWPYHPKDDGASRGQGPPSEGAVEEARKYVLKSVRKTSAKDVDSLKEHLNAGRPVVLGVYTYPSWDYPMVEDTGEIPMPLPKMQSDGGHAVCLVGYEIRNGVPGGGSFIFRNSWGRKWARRNGRFGAGYGTLFFDYIRNEGIDAFRASA